MHQVGKTKCVERATIPQPNTTSAQKLFLVEVVGFYKQKIHSSHFPSVKTWAYIQNFSSSLQSICKQGGCAHFMCFPFLQSVAEKDRQKLILGFMFCLTWLLRFFLSWELMYSGSVTLLSPEWLLSKARLVSLQTLTLSLVPALS